MSFFHIKLFFAIVFLCHYTTAADNKDDSDRGASDRSALWFGPRLGKRSLRSSEDNRQTFLKLLEAADTLKYYYDQLPYFDSQSDDSETRVTKKVVFTPKLGRNLENAYPERRYENVEFTPRLGRRLVDDLNVTPPDQDMYKQDPEQTRRTKFFAPRLGRTVNFSPRLGRDVSYDIYPEAIRISKRSINDTTPK